MKEGEKHAWETLSRLTPPDVCARSGAVFDRDAGAYCLSFFGHEVAVCPGRQEMSSESETATFLLGRLGYFAGVSLLNYLIHAVKPEGTGRVIHPAEIRGMQTYFTGSHRLPLEGVAGRYGSDKDAFLSQAQRFGGEPTSGGDAAVRLLPLTGLPVVLILWLGDDEFPARADLLVDEVCQSQVPIDIVWSVAMLSVLAMQM